MIPWAVELSEFDIEYTPRKAIKAQVVAEVLADFAEGEVKKPELGIREELYGVEPGGEVWQLQVDGSSTRMGSEVGVLVEPLRGSKIMYCIRMGFPSSNNEAEYEALIARLWAAKNLGAEWVRLRTDSQLIANQVNGSFVAKEARMARYLTEVKKLVAKF